jgi:hypothetical protein
MKYIYRRLGESAAGSEPTESQGPSRRLEIYGELLFSCSGTGELFDSEEKPWRCQFEAGQLHNGDCLILCDFTESIPSISLYLEPPLRFSGTTEDGRTLTTSDLIQTNYLPETPKDQSGTYLALHARRLDFASEEKSLAKSAIFGLSNLALRGQPIRLPHEQGELIISPIGGQTRESRLRTLKGIFVSAELEIPWQPNEESLHQVVDDICYLLSLARGTKIQWIYRADVNEDGKILRSSQFYRVTKKYTPLSLIDYSQPEAIEQFLTKALPIYQSRRESWSMRNVIDSYLDAKSEGDFLEMRGVKLAVAVEMLKASFIEATGHPEYMMDPEEFALLLPDLKAALKSSVGAALNSPQRRCAYGHLQSLNRLQFREVLKPLCDFLGLEVNDEDLSLFVKSRNNLIHHGRFTSDRRYKLEGTGNFNDSTQEYFWLAHFVDRLFLRLVDYDGPYFDWSTPGPPVLRERV